ncbi:MAG: hypothetical protein H0Z32_04670 [Bacillaceae bacterium]|nr:hypothetical protein [Bacillaceae bacterium]
MYRRQVILPFLLCIVVLLVYPIHVLADDDDHEEEEYGEMEEEESELLEESGEVIGWSIVALAGFAAAIYPGRKIAPHVLKKPEIRKNPHIRKPIQSVIKLTGKWHVSAGILALLAAISHGFLMLIYEKELGPREMIGIGSIGFLIFALFQGLFLTTNKTNKPLRKFHIVTVTIFIVLSAAHIVLS